MGTQDCSFGRAQELHVLAVDDSIVDRKVIERLLKISCCKVTVVESGRRALQFLGLDGDRSSVEFDELKVNLIMTYYSMPGLSRIKVKKEVPKSSVASNGTIPSEPLPGKTSSLRTKNKSLNEKPAANQTSSEHGNPDATSSSTSGAPSEEPMEEAKLKAHIKETAIKAGEISDSSLPTAEDAKPRKVGALPAYNWSFRCDERAEKRREFYSKLEEKIHAQEVEKNNMQAKTKESQEAEIKRLRKSLKFKATPMPSFYQEPTPPKMELKKD